MQRDKFSLNFERNGITTHVLGQATPSSGAYDILVTDHLGERSAHQAESLEKAFAGVPALVELAETRVAEKFAERNRTVAI